MSAEQPVRLPFHVDGKRVEEEFDCRNLGEGGGDGADPADQGPNIYWQHLEEHGVGLHHIKDVTPDEEIPAALEPFQRQGCRVLQTGWIDDDDVHHYLDTKDRLGLVFEVGSGAKIGQLPERYPAEVPRL